jgi:hypothetical protein
MNELPINSKTAIIINPYQAGGGDKALGSKVNACLQENGYTTKIIGLDIDPDIRMATGFLKTEEERELRTRECITEYTINQTRNFIKNDTDKTTAFNDSLIVISPLNKNKFFYLPETIKKLQQHYKFKKDNLLIIDELGSSIENTKLNSEGKLPYSAFKEQLGFKFITDRSLGFDSSKQQIGYFPIDNAKLELIDKNYKHNLNLLFDSFNFNLTANDMFLFGYISSEYFTSIINLIYNSLIELESLEKYKTATSINYIMLFRETYIRHHIRPLINLLTGIDEIKKYIIKEYNINFYLCDDDDYILAGYIDKRKSFDLYLAADNLESKARITPLYQFKSENKNARQLNIFLIQGTIKLPANTFINFIKLADIGIMTGDQSLFEYMSIKKELPYYDMQFWKTAFVDNLLAQAQKSNIDSLQEYYAAKFFGRGYNRGKISNFINISVSLNITKNESTLNTEKRKSIRRKTIQKITVINQQKHQFESKLLKQDARLFIKKYLENISMISNY